MVTLIRDADGGRSGRSNKGFAYSHTCASELLQGTFRLDRKGNWVSLNEAGARILGLESPDDILNGHGTVEFVPNEGSHTQIARALLARGFWTGELLAAKGDGSGAWILAEVAVLSSDRGRPIGYQGRFVDITERKSAERLLKTLTERSPIATYILQEGKFQHVNSRVQECLGMSESELIGTESTRYILPGDRDVVRAAAIAMLRGKLVQPYQYRIVRPNGEIRWAIETLTPITFSSKRAILGNFIDVTEQRLLQEKVLHYEELDELKSNLLSVVSHELRTPLAIIKGYTQMLVNYGRRIGKVEKASYLEAIDKTTDRLIHEVDQLLDISRIDAGLLRLQKARVDPAGLIETAVAEARIRQGTHTITCCVGELPTLNIDAARIRQVLDNLIDNACRYSEAGTEVAIAARREGSGVVVEVTDHGIGISADRVPGIFDRMQRIEDRMAQPTKGLGLGLSIAKRLVEAHEGRIWVHSQPARGSTFAFALPAGDSSIQTTGWQWLRPASDRR